MCRWLIYRTSFVLVLSMVSSASADLAVHWEFDDSSGTSAKDSSGNGNNGTLSSTGNGGPKWVDGMLGGALEFDGTDDEVLKSFPASEWPTGTVALWVKATTLGQGVNTGVFASHRPSPTGLQIDVEGTNPGNYRVKTDSGSGADLFGPVTLDWVHLGLTWDGASVNCYYDGDLATTGTFTAAGRTFNQFRLCTNRNTNSWFAGTIDDLRVYDHTLTQTEIQRLVEGGIPPGPSFNPSPANEATDVPRDVVLGWAPGAFVGALSPAHKVFFSESFDNANDAVGGITQDANSYTPPQHLDFGKTYYWRVDEANSVSGWDPGAVWSFTTEPFAYPIPTENITVTASSAIRTDEGPENIVNGSGLDDDDLHSLENTDMWLSSGVDPNATWMQCEFDRVYKLHQMLVWNYNSSVEPLVGFGIKEATIEYSVDGIDWSVLGTTHEFA